MINASTQIVVVKFGGSVLDSTQSVSRAASLVHDALGRGNAVVVVVSAMKGVTDNLIELSKMVNPKIGPSSIDELLSFGERSSARLFTAALRRAGVNALTIEPESEFWPIVTDGNHQDANPLVEESTRRVKSLIVPLLSEGRVPVICGFLGKSMSGKITTLGRGGSDTTAVVLGKCLQAREVVLIKDTEGVFSSDPDAVDNPYILETLDGVEAERLASGGAKFLHSKALQFKPEGLRIRITSLDKFDSGTVIEGEIPDLAARLEEGSVTMITVVGTAGVGVESIMELTRAVESVGAKMLSLSLEANSVMLYVTGGRGLAKAIHEVVARKRIGKASSTFEALRMLTLSGKRLETTPGLIQRVTQPLARAKINLYGILTISSSIRVFVHSSQAEAALEMMKKAVVAEGTEGWGRE
jgi:aspartate kinase